MVSVTRPESEAAIGVHIDPYDDDNTPVREPFELAAENDSRIASMYPCIAAGLTRTVYVPDDGAVNITSPASV